MIITTGNYYEDRRAAIAMGVIPEKTKIKKADLYAAIDAHNAAMAELSEVAEEITTVEPGLFENLSSEEIEQAKATARIMYESLTAEELTDERDRLLALRNDVLERICDASVTEIGQLAKVTDLRHYERLTQHSMTVELLLMQASSAIASSLETVDDLHAENLVICERVDRLEDGIAAIQLRDYSLQSAQDAALAFRSMSSVLDLSRVKTRGTFSILAVNLSTLILIFLASFVVGFVAVVIVLTAMIAFSTEQAIQATHKGLMTAIAAANIVRDIQSTY